MAETAAIAQHTFFTRDKSFYRTIIKLLTVIVFQNLIAYSINIADNIMLGSYSQAALSGAATVNQIQFVIQQLSMAVGDSLVILGSQYWGKARTKPIRQLTWFALFIAVTIGMGTFILTSVAPQGLLRIFTDNNTYIAEGMEYLDLIRFTYPVFMVSAILMAALRSVEIVNLSLVVSAVSLILDVGINDVLIFGKFGFSEMGVRGAGVGTVVARVSELLIIVLYMIFREKKLRLFTFNDFKLPHALMRDYLLLLWPSLVTKLLWSITTPIQTALLGHLSDDAIAANSVSTTLFQYLKIIAVSEASASVVVIGKTIGSTGTNEKVREYSRTLQIIFIFIGIVLGAGLFLLRKPFLGFYDLTPEALRIADSMLLVLSVAMVGMAYQMPTSVGIIKGGGDIKFILYLNILSTWAITLPASLLGVFVFHVPAVAVVALMNADQLLKCLPVAIHCQRYRWIKRLARSENSHVVTERKEPVNAE